MLGRKRFKVILDEDAVLPEPDPRISALFKALKEPDTLNVLIRSQLLEQMKQINTIDWSKL